jgi:S-adenosylmethionine synthetase
MVTTGLVFIAGEITSNATVEYPQIARRTIERIGYDRAKYGFDCHTCGVLTAIHEQSGDIAMGVDTGGAGDQGMMFGYACNDTGRAHADADHVGSQTGAAPLGSATQRESGVPSAGRQVSGVRAL